MFSQLPMLALENLCLYLSKQDMRVLSLVCKDGRDVSNLETIWRQLLKRDFGAFEVPANFQTSKEYYRALDNEASRFVDQLVINYFYYLNVGDLRHYHVLTSMNLEELLASPDAAKEEIIAVKARAKKWLQQILLHTDEYLSLNYLKKVEAIRADFVPVTHSDTSNLLNLDFSECSDKPTKDEMIRWYKNADFFFFSLKYLTTLNCRHLINLILTKQPAFINYVFCGRYDTTLLSVAISDFHADLVDDLIRFAASRGDTLTSGEGYVCVNKFCFEYGLISSPLLTAVVSMINVVTSVLPSKEKRYVVYRSEFDNHEIATSAQWVLANREELFTQGMNIISALMLAGCDPTEMGYCALIDGSDVPLDVCVREMKQCHRFVELVTNGEVNSDKKLEAMKMLSTFQDDIMIKLEKMQNALKQTPALKFTAACKK